MDKNNQPFTAKLVDEQIDHFLASLPTENANEAMIADLQHMYQADEHSLARVWQRLDLQHEQQSHTTQLMETLHPQQAELQPLVSMSNLEKTHRVDQSHKHLFARKLSLISAILVAALLVGSMFWIFNLARPNSSGTTHPQLSAHAEIYLFTKSSLIKMDARTHNVIWQQPLVISTGIAKPILAGNVLYVLSSSPSATSATSRVASILAIDASSGHTLWTHPLVAQPGMAYTLIMDMAFAKDQLYVAVENSDPQATTWPCQIYVLNTSDGSQHNVYPVANDKVHMIRLATGDGLLAVGAEGSLQVYDLASGKLRWHVSIADAYIQSMRIVDGMLYATASTDSFQNHMLQAYLAVYKASTGDPVWQSATFYTPAMVTFYGEAFIAFTVEHNILYFGTAQSTTSQDQALTGSVYAYDVQHKKMLWVQKVDGGVQLAPLVQNGLVYVSTNNGSDARIHVAALTTQKGEVKWQKTFNNNNRIVAFSSSEGIVYVYSASNTVQSIPTLDALKAENGDVLWEDTQYRAINYIAPIT